MLFCPCPMSTRLRIFLNCESSCSSRAPTESTSWTACSIWAAGLPELGQLRVPLGDRPQGRMGLRLGAAGFPRLPGGLLPPPLGDLVPQPLDERLERPPLSGPPRPAGGSSSAAASPGRELGLPRRHFRLEGLAAHAPG